MDTQAQAQQQKSMSMLTVVCCVMRYHQIIHNFIPPSSYNLFSISSLGSTDHHYITSTNANRVSDEPQPSLCKYNH